MAKKNVIEQMIGMLRAPIAQRKGVAIPPDECAIWAKELERYLVIEKEKKDQIETKEVDLNAAVERYVEQHKSELKGYVDIRQIARYFFVLGFNTQKGKL